MFPSIKRFGSVSIPGACALGAAASFAVAAVVRATDFRPHTSEELSAFVVVLVALWRGAAPAVTLPFQPAAADPVEADRPRPAVSGAEVRQFPASRRRV